MPQRGTEPHRTVAATAEKVIHRGHNLLIGQQSLCLSESFVSMESLELLLTRNNYVPNDRGGGVG